MQPGVGKDRCEHKQLIANKCMQMIIAMAGMAAQGRRLCRGAHLRPVAGPRLRHMGRVRLARAATRSRVAAGVDADSGTAVGGGFWGVEGEQRVDSPPAPGDRGISCWTRISGLSLRNAFGL
jgi:hypothetical protein